MNTFSDDLLGLREGTLGFDQFVRRNRDKYLCWASYFLQRWPQDALGVEDLIQEALLATWRAVDNWDPRRGPTLKRFVSYHVGRTLRLEIERVLGWPRRGKRPVTFVEWSDQDQKDRGPGPDQRYMVEEFAKENARSDFERDVIVGVGVGASVNVVASYLWEDRRRRYAYQLDSRNEARRRVSAKVRAICERCPPGWTA